jgi:hypothetical protein
MKNISLNLGQTLETTVLTIQNIHFSKEQLEYLS